MSRLALSSLLALSLLADPASAFSNSHLELPIPASPLDGLVLNTTLAGPAPGQELFHVTWDLTYVSSHGGTQAADVILELTVPLESGPATMTVTGADLGWPAAAGTFTGSLSSDLLDGILAGTGPSTEFGLSIRTATGGVIGNFTDSAITLELPGICQTDLGFGGPGAVQLSICGDLLSAGNVATLSLSGAQPFAPMLFVAGISFGPLPFKGGTLVPVPRLLGVFFMADATGGVNLTVPGGWASVTAYLQAVVADPAQPFGVAISNAVQFVLLP
ncbi:MAG TPA: hypothetical protein VFD43_11990 [Planctomycetota bacterium]|nr:hypothetical protein [Planctomycetota bacterium]